MYNNRIAIRDTAIANGGADFTPNPYWSSSEINSDFAWSQNFGGQVGTNKLFQYQVCAVRAF